MAKRVNEPEERDCDSPGTVMPSQLAGLPPAFAVKGIEPVRWGQYIYDVLAYHRILWGHGGKLECLSCHEAGLVLEALYFGARGDHHAH
jgi:hypothetical protein